MHGNNRKNHPHRDLKKKAKDEDIELNSITEKKSIK